MNPILASASASTSKDANCIKAVSLVVVVVVVVVVAAAATREETSL